MLRVETVRLLLAIQHRNVWRHLTLSEPGQKLTRAIALVGSHTGRLQSEPFACSFQHLASGNDFLTEPCWCRDDARDDAASAVDQIVVKQTLKLRAC